MSGFALINHNLIENYLAIYRGKDTKSYDCYKAIESASYLLASEISKHMEYDFQSVATLTNSEQMNILCNNIVLVSKIRSGLIMEKCFVDTFRTSNVGHVLLERNGATATDMVYSSVPKVSNSQLIILDSLVGTGGTMLYILDYLSGCGLLINNKISVASLMIGESGIQKILRKYPYVTIFSSLVTNVFDSNIGVFPRIGDFGDRVYGA
jgi:uracil phosphoribosyltransferase